VLPFHSVAKQGNAASHPRSSAAWGSFATAQVPVAGCRLHSVWWRGRLKGLELGAWVCTGSEKVKPSQDGRVVIYLGVGRVAWLQIRSRSEVRDRHFDARLWSGQRHREHSLDQIVQYSLITK
jgi:hypothetical protein